MISAAFHAVIYNPIYNGLVFAVNHLPTHDVGIAVIIITIIVRIIIFPLSKRAVETQIAMKAVTPEIDELKKKYKDNPQEQGRAIFALYKEKNVRPFAGFLLILVQLPILLGLYFVFARGGLPQIDPSILYSFVPIPPTIDMEFLGLINMATPSLLLAVLATVTQFIYTRLSMGPRGTVTPTEASFSADMARTFDLQARYILPLMIGGFAYFIAAAAPLYWVTSNIFMIGQEYMMGRRFDGTRKSR